MPSHTTLTLIQRSAAGPRTFQITISDAVKLDSEVHHDREQAPLYGFLSWDSDVRPIDYDKVFGKENNDG